MKKILIKKSKDGQYYFIAKSENGKIILASEPYTTKARCKTGIAAVSRFFSGSRELRNDIDIIDTTLIKKLPLKK